MSDTNSNQQREPPTERTHETYTEDHWRVADIENVDAMFAAYIPTDFRAPEAIRLDVDGTIAGGVSDVGVPGDNINASIWLSPKQAVELIHRLAGELRRREGREE